MIKVNCKICEKQYKTYPSKSNRKITCSKVCHSELKKRQMANNKIAVGVKHTDEWKKEQSKRLVGNTNGFVKGNVGEKCVNWNGGLTSLNKIIRNSQKYKNWRIRVFRRDNWTCQECGDRGVELNADHIKSFAYFPELRFVLSNGRTLCVQCHKDTENYGWKNYNGRKLTAPITIS